MASRDFSSSVLSIFMRGGAYSAIKNKWSSRWTKAGFYCKVPLHVCPRGGGSVHRLHSHMRALRFRRKPSFDCPDDDLSDNAIVWASKCVRGREAIEEFVSRGA
jgi:hypothetical protein